MRFPGIPFMKRTFDLIKHVGLEDKLIDYVLDANENLSFFNGMCFTQAELDHMGPDPFQTKVPDITGTASAMADEQLGPFMRALKRDFKKGWKQL
jgi:hypothetical protein